MKIILNGVITVHVDVVFRLGNNFHIKITLKDSQGDIIDLSQYPDMRWVFFNYYNKQDVKLELRIGQGLVVQDKSIVVFIAPQQIPLKKCGHELKLSTTLDLMSGESYADEKMYSDSYLLPYSEKVVVGDDAGGLTVDIFGDIIESQFIDLDPVLLENLAVDAVYKIQR